MVQLSWWSNSSPAAQKLGLMVQEDHQRGYCFQICSLKNVPKTASIPYGWCPSPVPEVHKFREPFLKFLFVPLPQHFLFGCCSPKHPHSNQTEMLEDKVNNGSPSAPGPSPAGLAETTGLCLAASLSNSSMRFHYGEPF